MPDRERTATGRVSTVRVLQRRPTVAVLVVLLEGTATFVENERVTIRAGDRAEDEPPLTEDEIVRNTLLQVVCRVHPDGADAYGRFYHEWWPANRHRWFTIERACGAWLYSELDALRKRLREVENAALAGVLTLCPECRANWDAAQEEARRTGPAS